MPEAAEGSQIWLALGIWGLEAKCGTLHVGVQDVSGAKA